MRALRRMAYATTAMVLAGPNLLLAQSREPYPGLDAYISNAVKTWKIPGLSVAIVRNDSVVYAKGFGVLAAGGTTPVNERTLFEIGSSSKAFTATLVAMQVSDGKMRWDDPLAAYLADFRMYDPAANGAVTLRDALSHRSGIARGELTWLGSGLTRDEVLHHVRFLKPESPFRSKYSYQNMMVLAAGEAAAKAAGTSWENLVTQRIFQPLGMTSSVATSKAITGSISGNVATPHGMDADTAFRKGPFDAVNIAPAGSILSNAVDMAQWLRFQLNDGMANGKRLMSSAALREIHTPQILTGAGGASVAVDTAATHFRTYGMGWFVEDYHGALVWQHGGNTPGMTAAVGMLPEKRVGVAVLSNMQSAALPQILENYIFERALGLPVKDLSAIAYARSLVQRKRADSLERAQELARVNAPPPVPLASFVGTYSDSLYGDATVTLAGDQLAMTRGDWSAPLQYWNATNFRWMLPAGTPTGRLFVKFDVAPDNSVTGLYFGLPGDQTLLSRKSPRGGAGPRAARAAESPR